MTLNQCLFSVSVFLVILHANVKVDNARHMIIIIVKSLCCKSKYKGESLCHDHMLITVNIFSIKSK